MKGIFWNCNEFRDPKKYRFISDLKGAGSHLHSDFGDWEEEFYTSIPQKFVCMKGFYLA
jgi:hypothetical protein